MEKDPDHIADKDVRVSGLYFGNEKAERKIQHAVLFRKLGRTGKTFMGLVLMQVGLAFGMAPVVVVSAQLANRLVVVVMKKPERHLHIQEGEQGDSRK